MEWRKPERGMTGHRQQGLRAEQTERDRVPQEAQMQHREQTIT